MGGTYNHDGWSRQIWATLTYVGGLNKLMGGRKRSVGGNNTLLKSGETRKQSHTFAVPYPRPQNTPSHKTKVTDPSDLNNEKRPLLFCFSDSFSWLHNTIHLRRMSFKQAWGRCSVMLTTYAASVCHQHLLGGLVWPPICHHAQDQRPRPLSIALSPRANPREL